MRRVLFDGVLQGEEKGMINSYVSIDLETSGLDPKQDRILEIAAIKVVNGEVTDMYETLVDAGVHLDERIVSLTGITEEMTKEGAEPAEAIRRCVEFIGDMPILGHCIQFDYSFLKRTAVNHDLAFEKEGIDTLRIARKVLPDLESRGLSFLCAYYQIPLERHHRAMADAKATLQLYQRLQVEFGEKNPELFMTKPLIYQVKKESPATNAQKRHLKDLIKYHKIELDKELDTLTRNEASRYIDRIILENGRLPKGRSPSEGQSVRG